MDIRLATMLFGSFAATVHAAPQEDTEKGRTHYKGREIAKTMHYLGAPWLVRENREREEECSTLLKVLGVTPGDVVCDLGCGNGFYTLKLAELVGAKGKVLAVDIQKRMLALLNLRAKKSDLAVRIEPILGTVSDPKLPEGEVDLVFMVDVYHELSHPETILREIRKSLAPRGRIVLVEFRSEDKDVPIKRLHKMSKRQMLREIVPNGFQLVQQFDGLPWQHVTFFAKALAAADDPLARKVRKGLARATAFIRKTSVRGGYLGISSLDLQKRYGEAVYEKAKPTEIWVQPPGTPSVGEVFLHAFRVTGDDTYFLAARDAGRALAWGQRLVGGWDHRVDVAHLDPRDTKAQRVKRKKGQCTFDDDISQGALTFLIELDDVAEEPWLTETVKLGIDHLLESQFDNGAWPQWYPLRGGYHDYYTFNDAAINDCIRVALLAGDRYKRVDCLVAALSGADFIIASQLEGPQAGWAQQYTHDLKPAPARAFEPAAVCSAVTARNIGTLMDVDIETKKAEYLAPIEPALAWLMKSRLPNGKWARFYELETNRPIYGDRDGKVYYRLDQISAERRLGYSWESGFGVESARRQYRRLKVRGDERDLAGQATRYDFVLQREHRRGLAPRVREILDALDEQGRWVRDGHIHIGDFVRNATVLCEYLYGARLRFTRVSL